MIVIIIIIILYLILSTKEHYANINNNIHIDDVFVLNLDKDLERWLSIKQHLNKANINASRISAINGMDLDVDKLKASGEIVLHDSSFFNHNIDGRDSLKGSIACGISHKKIWNRVLNDPNITNALILEDDANVPTDFWSKFNELNIPNNWDIIFCGGMRIYGDKISENIIKAKFHDRWFNCGLYGYIINKKSAQKLLDICTPITNYIDVQMNHHYSDSINAYYINPFIITHNSNFPSSRIVSGDPDKIYNYDDTFKESGEIIRLID